MNQTIEIGTYKNLITRLTVQGFIIEHEDGNISTPAVNDKGLSIEDYIQKFGFTFLDVQQGTIHTSSWNIYINQDIATGIKSNGKTWTWDNTTSNVLRDFKRNLDGQAMADYKKSNIDWDA